MIASAAVALASFLARLLASVIGVVGCRGTRGTALRLRFVIITTRLPGLSTRSMLQVVARGFAGPCRDCAVKRRGVLLVVVRHLLNI